PYSDPRELLRQILWYGADVEVIEPSDLRAAVARAHENAATRYR
ncbi:MAG: WYL domain-containing protein, partial [Gammaproteobacteria bacterium]